MAEFDTLASSLHKDWRLSTLCEPSEACQGFDRDGKKAKWSVTLSHREGGVLPVFGGGATPTEAMTHALERLEARLV